MSNESRRVTWRFTVSHEPVPIDSLELFSPFQRPVSVLWPTSAPCWVCLLGGGFIDLNRLLLSAKSSANTPWAATHDRQMEVSGALNTVPWGGPDLRVSLRVEYVVLNTVVAQAAPQYVAFTWSFQTLPLSLIIDEIHGYSKRRWCFWLVPCRHPPWLTARSLYCTY